MKKLIFFFLLLIPFNAGAVKPVFEALSGHHNLDPWDHVLGVPDPSIVWSGDNTNGSDNSCTETGTTAEITTPFCSHGACMKARRFEAGEYYTCGDRLGLSDYPKISVVTVSRKGPAGGDDRIAGHRSGGQGWTLYHGASDVPYIYVGNSAGNQSGVGTTQAGNEQWVFMCGTVNDTAHTTFMHDNGKEDAASAVVPTGTYTDGAVLEIGTLVAGTGDMVGDIALFAGWEGTELTYAQCKSIFHAFFDWYEPRGKSPITWSNTGPTSAFVNGSIETFSDDFPRVGVEVAPGLTGAGNPSVCGAHLHPSVANYMLYSQDMSTGWTESGVAVVGAATATTLRASGQGYYTVTDDDGAGVEIIYEQVTQASMGDLALTDVVHLSVYARYALGDTFSTVVQGQTGALCTTASATLTDFVGTGEWQLYASQVVWDDDDCTNVTSSIYPYDQSDGAAATGVLDVAYVALTKNQTFGSLLCDTSGAAVTCGNDAAISYDDSANNHLLTAAGEFKGNYRILFGLTPFVDDLTGADDLLLNFQKDANDRLLFYVAASDQLYVNHVDGGVSSDVFTLADPTWTPGQTYTTDTFWNFERDSYRINLKGASSDSDNTAKATPSGITKMDAGSPGFDNGGCVGPVRILR